MTDGRQHLATRDWNNLKFIKVTVFIADGRKILGMIDFDDIARAVRFICAIADGWQWSMTVIAVTERTVASNGVGTENILHLNGEGYKGVQHDE